jgi:hypothetical protein
MDVLVLREKSVTALVPGKLYRLKKDVILLKEESLYSRPLPDDNKFLRKGNNVLFVEMSSVVQRVASSTDRTRDDRYRFMKLIVGDLIGWCPFFASTLTPDGHWQILEENENINDSNQPQDISIT